MESLGRYVAQVWHEVLMNSATAEDVAKYAPLAGRSPVELRILLLAGSTQDLPLSAYAEALHLPKRVPSPAFCSVWSGRAISAVCLGKQTGAPPA